MDEKFCINCEQYSYKHNMCNQPHNCGRITEPTGTDLVTGIKIMNVLDATAERVGEGSELCGESGKYFEPRAE